MHLLLASDDTVLISRWLGRYLHSSEYFLVAHVYFALVYYVPILYVASKVQCRQQHLAEKSRLVLSKHLQILQVTRLCLGI